MTTLIETGSERVFQAQAMTEHGLSDFWLDNNLNWRVRASNPEFVREVEGFSWDVIGDHLERVQVDRALDAVEEYISIEFRRINEALRDEDGVGSPEWQETFDRFGPIFRGLSHFLHRTNMVNDVIEDRDAGFGFNVRSFSLARGRHELELHALTHWVELAPATLERPSEPQRVDVDLAGVLEFANGAERLEVIAAHLDLVKLYAAHLRYLVNKIRAGAAVSQSEIGRLCHSGSFAAALSRELEVL